MSTPMSSTRSSHRSRLTTRPVTRARAWLALAVLLGTSVLTTNVFGSTTASARTNVDVKIVHTDDGPVLANGEGKVLYVYTEDLQTSAPSACTGGCASDWPPAVITGKLRIGPGIAGSIGTVRRSNGARQLTIDRRPLYTFAGDQQPGDVRGQGVGNEWFLIQPNGLTDDADPPPAPTYSAKGTTTLTLVQTRLGQVLAGSSGQVLYRYRYDSPGQTACEPGWCQQDWPPLTTTSTPTAAPGIAGTLGTIPIEGGFLQVTLDGYPLYYFAGDLHPGDIRGEGVGHAWALVSASGSLVFQP